VEASKTLKKKTLRKKTRKKPSIAKKKNIKQVYVPDWRTHYTFWSAKELPMISLERLAENVVEVIKTDETVLSWNKVMVLLDIYPEQYYRFEERCPKLKDSRKFAMLTIGVRREELALTRKIDANVMKHMQGVYDKSWAAQEKRHAELRKNIASESGTKIIVMSEFGSKSKKPS
jgi:hypothetical protein